MKGNQIDDLFRQKLGHQKLNPPPAAWSAIEQNLPTKKKKGAYFWMSIAASILVIFTLGWLLLDKGESKDLQDVIGSDTQAKVEETAPIKAPVEAKEPVQPLVADAEPTPKVLPQDMEEPAVKNLVAKSEDKLAEIVEANRTQTAAIEETPLRVAPMDIPLITIDNRMAPATKVRAFNYDMLMPLDVTAYYTPYTEDLELVPRKRKFRVLNGIISVAKEVNSGKLSFQELRNKKNNFIVDDLKYGSKEVDSDSGEDEPDPPGKD